MSDLRTIIAIDQGTTSSRAILFDEEGTILAQQSAEFSQHFPADGWVEHDPEDIWQTTIDVTSAMVAESRSRGSLSTTSATCAPMRITQVRVTQRV